MTTHDLPGQSQPLDPGYPSYPNYYPYYPTFAPTPAPPQQVSTARRALKYTAGAILIAALVAAVLFALAIVLLIVVVANGGFQIGGNK